MSLETLKGRTQLHPDFKTVPQLLAAAKRDTDPVAVFALGQDMASSKEFIFITDAAVGVYLYELLRRQRLVTDKTVAAPPDIDVNNPATCAGCGCTDRRACAGGCYWIAVDRDAKSGICSNCQPALKAWRNQRPAA